MPQTTPVAVAVPRAASQLQLLDHVDYEDAFAINTSPTVSPEQLMRAFVQHTPKWFALSWFTLGTLFFGLKVGPLSGSADHICGWEIVHEHPDAFAVGLNSSSGLCVRLITVTAPEQLILVTQVRLATRCQRAMWPRIAPGHRFSAPYLLSRAAADADRP
jgi:hypothetical protein